MAKNMIPMMQPYPISNESVTFKGISFSLSRYGRVVSVAASSGTTSEAIGSGSTIGTIPEKYRPTSLIAVKNVIDNNAGSRIQITSAGAITIFDAVAKGAYIRFNATFVRNTD